MKWKGIQHLTLRAAGWGRGDFISSTDAFNARTVGIMLKAFTELRSFRALGVSGLDISPECVRFHTFYTTLLTEGSLTQRTFPRLSQSHSCRQVLLPPVRLSSQLSCPTPNSLFPQSCRRLAP